MVMSAKNIGKKAGADVGKALGNIGSMRPDIKADDSELKAAAAPQKAQSFGEAFRAARADKGAGKTFTWGGKSYSTNMAGEGIKRPQPARSGTGSGSSAVSRPSTPAASRPSTPAASRPSAPAASRPSTPATPPAPRANPLAAAAMGKDTLKANIERRNKLVAPKKEPGFFERMTTNIATRNRDAMAKAEDARKAKAIADRAAKAKEDAAAKKRAEDFRKANVGWEFGMKAPGKAKGGKIDGCAIRGKTRAPLKKGK